MKKPPPKTVARLICEQSADAPAGRQREQIGEGDETEPTAHRIYEQAEKGGPADTPPTRARLPPGQVLTEKWPVLHAGSVPSFDPATWNLKTLGLVERPLCLSWDDVNALPQAENFCDIHCVTTWSRYDNRFGGVAFKTITDMTRVKAAAKFVMLHCEQGYTANLSLADCMEDGVLFATRHDGAWLSPDHGFPLRLVCPKLYLWKSAKWVRAVEFMADDRRGFWEMNGYHNHADPWREQRYSWQEDD